MHHDTAAITQARAIKQDNVLLVGPFAEGRPVEDATAPGKLTSGFRRCNIALVIAWPGVATPYPSIARLLHRNGIAYSLILCGPPNASPQPHHEPVPMPRALAAFFPIEDPSPCWRCLELRWLGWAPRVSTSMQWLEALQFPQRFPSFVEPPPDQEQLVLLSWTAMEVLGADAGTVRIVAEDGSFSTHAFLPHPQCAWCSPWAGVKAERDTRVVGMAELMDGHFGLVRPTLAASTLPAGLAPTASDPLDPIFLQAARRTRARAGSGRTRTRATKKSDKDAALHDHCLHVAHGSPYFAPDDALFPALPRVSMAPDETPAELLLDALAVYAMRLRAGRPLWRGTRRGVALSAPNPRDWIFPLLDVRDGQPFHEHLELDWARAHDLQSGDLLGIPADLVFSAGPCDAIAPRDALAFADVSLAVAHPKLELAVQGALERVAENDALMATWYAGLAPPRIPHEDLPAPFADAVKEATTLDVELAVLDLTTDIGVPVLAIVGRTADRWFYGCGASMVPQRALRNAWAQLGQCYARKLSNPGRDVDFLFAGPVRDFPQVVPGGDTDPIDTWRYLLEVGGMQALWIDITPPDVALAHVVVARAWVEGAIPRPPADVPLDLDPDHVTTSPGGIRLLELPMRMRLADAPLQPEDLNAKPHPFV